jgi:PAS domain S-box-containing protein
VRSEFDPQGLFDGLHDEAVLLDESGTIVLANRAWRQFCRDNGGDTDAFYVGHNYLNTSGSSTGVSSAEASIVAEGLREVLEGGAYFRCEYPCNSPRERRWFEMTAAPVELEDRRMIVVTHRNITSRKIQQIAAEDAHRDAELLAALVASSDDAILSYDLDGCITSWNPAAERLYGYRAEEVLGRTLEILYPEGWPIRVARYRDEIIAGMLKSFEATRVAKDGTERLVWITAAPIRNSQGEVVLISNIHRDITELRRAEEAREIMAREVLHRFKNLLAVIGAIQRQTQRSAASLEEFGQVFGNRVEALSRSADLLLAGNWDAAPLHDLVQAQLGPFSDGRAAPVTADGPAVKLTPVAVQVVGMALHELATNASKYGALRHPEGRIDFTWTLSDEGGEPQLVLRWVETGIEVAPQAGAGGFGQIVLETLPKSMLNATASQEMTPTRVVWTLKVPKSGFEAAALSAPA